MASRYFPARTPKKLVQMMQRNFSPGN